jgi:hypothetical protein
MATKPDKKLEDARANVRKLRADVRQWRTVARGQSARADAMLAGLRVLADRRQAWAKGTAEEVAASAARIAELALETGIGRGSRRA